MNYTYTDIFEDRWALDLWVSCFNVTEKKGKIAPFHYFIQVFSNEVSEFWSGMQLIFFLVRDAHQSIY